MKLIILLLSLVTGFGATVKKSSDDMKALKAKIELNQYSQYPNLLPVVEVVAPRIPNDSI
ncbi:hypothetical protein [Pontibacter arcticus]|uniref:Uncharacterized protein n=1 Tax=Pontibacter arcticus TaxID=2080288 RepID=A0A364RJ65_9BACT|nr:hypothetical protein [Pontibacter arcticus]RAU84370.1 hypothetical protein DP923_04850 [Pontibacter arcticus]